MRYEFVYTRRAEKDIKRLDSNIRNRIGQTILRYKDNPLNYAESLTDSAIGSYRFRIGDYRVIFDIEGSDIVILRVGHRRGIYKK